MDKNKRKIIQKKGKHYSETERHAIIQEMLKNNWTKQYAWELYNGEPEERGQFMRWMRKLGYVKNITHKKFNFGPKIKPSSAECCARQVRGSFRCRLQC